MPTAMTRDGGHTLFVTAEDPGGPWSDPVFVDVAGIDPEARWVSRPDPRPGDGLLRRSS